MEDLKPIFKVIGLITKSANSAASKKAKQAASLKPSKVKAEKLKELLKTLPTEQTQQEVDDKIHSGSILSIINSLDSDVKRFINNDNVLSYRVSDSRLEIVFFAGEDKLRLVCRQTNGKHHYHISTKRGKVLVDVTVKPVPNRPNQSSNQSKTKKP